MIAGTISSAKILVSLIQVLAVTVASPFVVGVMRSVRCRMEGRQGPKIRQPWRDLRKLFRKQRSQPHTASIFFAQAPVVLVASTVVVVWLVPLLSIDVPVNGGADLFAMVFLLLLGSVAMSLAALDTATAFGGMGASRLMTIVAVSEPALLVTILALAAPVHSSALPAIVTGALHHPSWLFGPQRLLALGAFVVITLAESGRLPVDNPATHLELTMIHEALILEYSGPDLAYVILGESMRLTLMFSLLANLFFPWGIAMTLSVGAILIGSLALALKVAAVAILVSIGEVAVAKLRLFRVPELLAGAFMLGTLAVVSALVVA